MELVSISEFLHLTNLSAQDLLTMLEKGEIRGAFTETGTLQIDISNITPEDLARRSAVQSVAIDKETQALIEEIVGAEIANQLETILGEALELSEEWAAKRQS